jgi:hypothetical protein
MVPPCRKRRVRIKIRLKFQEMNRHISTWALRLVVRIRNAQMSLLLHKAVSTMYLFRERWLGARASFLRR